MNYQGEKELGKKRTVGRGREPVIIVSISFRRKRRSGKAVYTKKLCLQLHKSEGKAHTLATNNLCSSCLADSNRGD